MTAAGSAYFVKSGDGRDAGGIYYGKDAPNFTLSDTEGNPVSIGSFKGKDVLLSFGYTSCPDIYPTTLTQLNSITQKLGENDGEDLQVLFVTIALHPGAPRKIHPIFQRILHRTHGKPGRD